MTTRSNRQLLANNGRLTNAFVVLLLGAFGIAAIFMAWGYASAVIPTIEARRWTAVPAVVDQWEHRSQRTSGSKGTTTTWRVEARYRYPVGGREYTGTRVGFADGWDNFSDDYRNRAIDAIRNPPSGQVVAWVDPANPARAVLIRSLPWEQALFRAVFLLFPCGISTYALLAGLIWLAAPSSRRGDWASRAGAPWAVLHGSLALPIAALAPPGAMGWLAWAGVIVLLVVGLAGLRALPRAWRRS
jgi:hypothetical protein